ncbi:hypothetical protein IC757_06610 [Wenzhouxiangella sp. AB-CW3]|uniref:ATP-grasp fold amidoligase family protein n=1 Tax=Wenzhouxiangella sp. AB-CW3 TaxID=2771012 RepID=UPI00168A4607|nr:ATP-grasp fold amidoligase family protein [Wenzhouxiangella sp. AB-CW3]QOC23793.1 hypothetical protein IC757_06610 [Wenzhouxiangella sp. AB-CW3]
MNGLKHNDLKVLVESAGSFPEFLDALADSLSQQVAVQAGMSRALKKVGYLALRRWPGHRSDLIRALAEYSTACTAPQLVVETAARQGYLWQMASFKTLMTLRSIKRSDPESRHSCYEWALDDKHRATKFIDALGLRRPRVYSYGKSIDDVDIQPPCALKPAYGKGSHGVYLAFAEDSILKVKTTEKLSSIGELRDSVSLDMEQGRVPGDCWIVEELLGNEGCPAVDLKFFSFYGEIELVLEVTRYPLASRWSEPDGETIESEFDLYDHYHDGVGATPEQLEVARRISLEVPAPFLRIDFVSSGGELCFGEFTPRPGSYADFSRAMDQRLGLAFLKAEGRLADDLFNGKRFDTFRGYLGQGG